MNYGPASKFYDLFGSEQDMKFYRDLALKNGRKALEFGVGTARVALELAKAGVTVWGIDNSRYMLKVARRKLEKEDAAVRSRLILRLGDMRNFKLKERFSISVMWNLIANSFSLLLLGTAIWMFVSIWHGSSFQFTD